MEETLKCVIIDHDKSTYRIEIIKAGNSKLFVSVEQTVYSDFGQQVAMIKIKPSALGVIVQTLIQMQEVLPDYAIKPKSRINPVHKDEIVRRYLNTGLEIEILAVQFNCSVRDIEQFLMDEGIAITSNKLPKGKPSRRFWRRKK